MFTSVLYDFRDNSYIFARDHVGIIPLYIGTGKNGERLVASELKGIWD